ncbi:unnamed protein product [Ostreobium quekettii]|uniref:Glutaredoxin domain-containing protein n=1 Tax=Ostreobium quekettii TaxID=121088 RepID=A0A8S1IVB3_9CHLO|nr:unnamed protein product [Ostreobium quekettii]|eukprot:evm.model.scf_12EXC.7 EVM.evm.TU.scf_12EXC.7   scf_12EXC:58603-62235(+)
MIESVRQKNEENKVIVYSRSWCPYCEEVTKLLAELDVNFTLVELDHIVEGDDIQDALYDITNSTTVPQVFVGGKFVGGCDDTVSLYKSGELKSIFSGAGVESSL